MGNFQDHIQVKKTNTIFLEGVCRHFSKYTSPFSGQKSMGNSKDISCAEQWGSKYNAQENPSSMKHDREESNKSSRRETKDSSII